MLGRPLAGLLLGKGWPSTARGDDQPIRERHPREEVVRRDALFRTALTAADVIAAGAAILLSVQIIGHDELRPAIALTLPLVVLVAKFQGLYDRDELLLNKTTIDQAPQLFHLAALCALLIELLHVYFIRGGLGTAQLFGLWFSLFVFTLLARGVARALARRVAAVERCLFVGSEEACQRLREKLLTSAAKAVIVSRMSLGDATDGQSVQATVATLRRLVDELRIQRVVIEPSEPYPQTTLDFVREAKGIGARVSLLPRILEVVGSSIEIDDLDGVTLLGVRRFGLSRSSASLKRAFDAVGAAIGLIALAPGFGVIAVAIKLDTRGPVFYRQPRVGRDGRLFAMWKFRTMIDGADRLKPALRDRNEAAGGLFKIADDPRITRAGRLLRRYSLDELPQLVNVLGGQMSLVGPRPLVVDEDAKITGLDRRRLYLTPGMTGHWQILGSARVPLSEMIKLDYLYLVGWSLWSDIKLLLRTVPYVLSRRGM